MDWHLKNINPEDAPLYNFLTLLEPYLSKNGVTELVINKPNELFIENEFGFKLYENKELDFSWLMGLAQLVSSNSGQSLEPETPILSATLPLGERVQVLIPPAVRKDTVSFTIRKPSEIIFTLDDYRESKAFSYLKPVSSILTDEDKFLLSLKDEWENDDRKIQKFLETCVKYKKNIVISGGTGTGKTTLMKALLRHIPKDERLISIENVDELGLYETHKNTVSLFYSAGGLSVSKIDQQQLLEASLRMKPDRIFLAELIRGDEAFYYLRNVGSGHGGSMTSMHANSAKGAFEQLVLFILESKSGSSMSRAEIKKFLLMSIDVIIQMNVIKDSQGRKLRVISEIYFDPLKKIELQNE